MRLLSIESASFGTLDIKQPLTLEPGLNICVAPNQAGKSTLLTLIEWSLYGVPPHGRRRNQALVERWSPWNGDDPAVSLTLAPELPDWPAKVGLLISFEEFSPTLTDLAVLRDLTDELLSIDRNGSWDLGQRLCGLSRQGMLASLIAHQGELTNLFNLEGRTEHEGLRKLLTADVAELVEDPERASLDSALRELDKPTFTMGDLSRGAVQLNYLLREATNRWRLAAGNLDTQRERFEQLEATLAQREEAEARLAEALGRLADIERERERLELAAVHWRYTRVSELHSQLASWEPQIREEPWLAEFPAEVQRSIDKWAAERHKVQEQIQAAGAQTREAEALKLRAPYVERIHVDTEQEMIRYGERLRRVRADLAEQKGKQERALARMEEIETYLDKHLDLMDMANKLPELTELQAALAAADADYATANAEVREYGEGRDANERVRLEELEGIIKPYRASVQEVADYIERKRQLALERGELEAGREQLTAQARPTALPWLYGGLAALVAAALTAYFGLGTIQPAVVAYLAILVLAAAGGWLLYGGWRRWQQAQAAQRELADTEPQLAEIAQRQAAIEEIAARVQERYAMPVNTWSHLVEMLPEYQRLRLSLDNYAQALGSRDSAEGRRRATWERVRTICINTPASPDTGWLTARLRVLREIVSQRTRKLDEHSKLRDAENALERLRQDEADLVLKLKRELEPLGLGPQLEKDEGLAIEHFQGMVRETRHYKQLLRVSASQQQLKDEDQQMLAQLERLLAPLGLAELAQSDPQAALREFELRRERAAAYSGLRRQLEEAQDQLRHLSIERDEYDRRWQVASAAEREGLTALVRSEEDYDSTAARRRELEDSLARTRRQADELGDEVTRLRERIAKDEDVRDEVEAAAEEEQRTRAQLATVRSWVRGVDILGSTLTDVLREMSSRLAPQLTEALSAVLKSAPVAGVKQAGLSGRLDLHLKVEGAPPGLDGDELLKRLSRGAQLQLALALRLAVAGALGHERPALLLLDEPLAELDDERATACLRYLGRLAENMQVLLATCHAQHYGWLAKQAGVEPNIVTLQ